jgi:hypothetical protein
MVPDMPSETPKGTVRQHPDGVSHIAVRMGPHVAVGEYFVISPDNGGYYENDPDKIAEIDTWEAFTPPVPPVALSPTMAPARAAAVPVPAEEAAPQ